MSRTELGAQAVVYHEEPRRQDSDLMQRSFPPCSFPNHRASLRGFEEAGLAGGARGPARGAVVRVGLRIAGPRDGLGRGVINRCGICSSSRLGRQNALRAGHFSEVRLGCHVTLRVVAGNPATLAHAARDRSLHPVPRQRLADVSLPLGTGIDIKIDKVGRAGRHLGNLSRVLVLGLQHVAEHVLVRGEVRVSGNGTRVGAALGHEALTKGGGLGGVCRVR
eukprot:scaffold4280_cov63-Phaeocystis_antarctica.AAC.2